MSINGVNQNQDIQKLLKLMKSSQGKKAGAANKLPAHLTMNGSIFNAPGLGNNANTISSVKSNNTVKTLNAQARNLEGTQTADNVLKANTTKSVSNVSKTDASSKTEGAKGQESNEKEQIDIGNYDFDNLTAVSDGELNDLKDTLTELKDGDIPRFLEVGIDKKLSKVKSELQKRASNEKTTGTEDAENEKKAQNDQASGKESVAESNNAKGDAQAATQQTEAGTQKMNQSESEMKRLDSKMKKDTKKMQKQMKTEQKAIDKAQKQMQKEAEK